MLEPPYQELTEVETGLVERLRDCLTATEPDEADVEAIETLPGDDLASLLEAWAWGPTGRDSVAGDLACEAARRLRSSVPGQPVVGPVHARPDCPKATGLPLNLARLLFERVNLVVGLAPMSGVSWERAGAIVQSQWVRIAQAAWAVFAETHHRGTLR